MLYTVLFATWVPRFCEACFVQCSVYLNIDYFIICLYLGAKCPGKGCGAALGVTDPGQPYPGPHRSGEQAARTRWQVCSPHLFPLFWYILRDQVPKVIRFAFCRSKGMRKYQAIDKWNTQLKSIYQTVSNKVGWDAQEPATCGLFWCLGA